MGKNLKVTLIAWPLIAAMSNFACCATAIVAGWFGIELQQQESVLQVKSLIGWNLRFLGVVTLLGVVAPVLEEFVFRYLLWKLPDARNFWAGTVPSSLLFVAAHYLEMSWPNDAFVGLFVFALGQCWLYRKTQRLVYPILNHSLFNLTTIAMIALFA